jgi:hypothetical protein
MTDTTPNTTNHNTVTSDEQVTAAKELGFKPTQAWVLTNPPEKPRSRAAERVKKSRELARERGIEQLNVSMPKILHGLMRELAKRTSAGDSFEAAVVALVPSISVPASPKSPQPAVSSSQRQPSATPRLTDLPVWTALPAWKRWLVSRLIRSKP